MPAVEGIHGAARDALDSLMIRLTRGVSISLIAAFLLGVGCTKQPEDPPAAVVKVQAESTVKMAVLLKRIASEMDLTVMEYGANEQRVAMLEARLKETIEWKERMPLQVLCSRKNCLAAGMNREVVACLDEIEQSMAQRGVVFTPPERQSVRMLRAQAHLRIGESENCCAEHNVDSCLVPLRGDAIYRHPEGPLKAIDLLQDQLADVPGDYTARWLLNIAHMTLGEYPRTVPPEWLIDPKVFTSDYDLKRLP